MQCPEAGGSRPCSKDSEEAGGGEEVRFLSMMVKLGPGEWDDRTRLKGTRWPGWTQGGWSRRLFLVLTKMAAKGVVKGESDHGRIMKAELTKLDKWRQLRGVRLGNWAVQVIKLCDTGRKAWGIMGIKSLVLDMLNLRYLWLDGWLQPTFPNYCSGAPKYRPHCSGVPKYRPQYQENIDLS